MSNHGPKYEMITTNDTEHLVQYMSTTGISDIEKYITGYYAVSALTPDGTLVVFKDSIASLYCAYVETIESYMFATTESLIQNVCKDLKWKHSTIEQVNDDIYIEFRGNEIVKMEDINPPGSWLGNMYDSIVST